MNADTIRMERTSFCSTLDSTRNLLQRKPSVEFEQIAANHTEEAIEDGLIEDFIAGTKSVDAVPFDKIEAISDGAPMENLYFESDTSSQVSIMTLLSAMGPSCILPYQIGATGDKSATSKMEDFMAGAANFVMYTMNGVMEDMAESIDPDVLEECQDRTRSMLSKSWGVAFENKNTRHFPRLPSSIFSLESSQRQRVFVIEASGIDVHGDSSPKGGKHEPCRCPSISTTGDLTDDSSSQGDSTPEVGIELTQQGDVIENGDLGEEVEVSVHCNDLVLDCRDMTAEVLPSPELDEDAGLNANIGEFKEEKKTSEGVFTEHKPSMEVIEVRRLSNIKCMFKVKMRKTDSNEAVKRKSSPFKPLRSSIPTTIRKGSKGSGKTVSTVLSDESSTTHTDDPSWIQDEDIKRILQL